MFGASTFPQNLKLGKDGFENFGGSGGGERRGRWVLDSNRPPPSTWSVTGEVGSGFEQAAPLDLVGHHGARGAPIFCVLVRTCGL